MPPIFINTPGSSLDSAGQGMAAAQQYRGNEQKMRLQEQGFKEEIGLAKRKLDIEEQDIAFQREQLAQQQEAAADYITFEMEKNGERLTPAQREAMKHLSPGAQERVIYGLGQQRRIAAERETFTRADAALADLEKNDHVGEKAAELRARIADGTMTPNEAVSAIARIEREANKIALVERQFLTVSAQVEKWTADETGAYDPPKEDDDAYDDVVDLEAKLSPNAPFDPKADYRLLWDQYKFLTTKGMREASRAILAAELEKKGLVPVDKEDYEKMLDERLAASSTKPEFRERAGATYGQAKAFTDRVRGPMDRLMGKGGAAATGEKGAPPSEPGSQLRKPIGKAEMEQMYGAPDADLQTDFMQALEDMGFTSIPQPGDPEYAVARDVMKAIKAKRAAQKKKPQPKEQDPYGGDGPPTFSQ